MCSVVAIIIPDELHMNICAQHPFFLLPLSSHVIDGCTCYDTFSFYVLYNRRVRVGVGVGAGLEWHKSIDNCFLAI